MRFFSLCLTLSLSVCLWAQDTTVVLVRHAERVSLFDDDSPLSATGQRRAEALVPVLESFHPAALFTSDRRRTQQTLAPLAARLDLKTNVRSKDQSSALSAEILKDHRGQTVLVCWHHDLMKKLAKGLGVQGPTPYWSLDSYDRIWVVRISARGEATLEERFQKPLSN
ncbi:MAG TPA: phosphoglycerate mutase family protein [Geothrix sp.]|nr:phosphoglycerate mutase family protein [Geothrix sp.]